MNKIFFICLLAALTITVYSQSSLHKTLNEGLRPSKNNIHVDIVDARGNYSSIPLSIIKGKESGPIFTVVSGVHGCEYSSLIAGYELIQEIDPALLSGTIIIVPLANPNSFYGRTPFCNPQDHINLNRAFPGDKHGSITKMIANYITTEMIPISDVFVDMHGGDINEDLLPFIAYYRNEEYPEQTAKIKRLAEVTGFKHIVSWPYNLTKNQPAKYAIKQASQDGKVTMLLEAGKLGTVQEEAVNLIKNGIYNMLTEMQMYQKEPGVIPDIVHLDQQAYIRSEHQGIFFSDHSAGDTVVKGDIVGVIKNVFGNILTELVAPASGTILYMTSTPPINLGETVMCIAYAL